MRTQNPSGWVWCGLALAGVLSLSALTLGLRRQNAALPSVDEPVLVHLSEQVAALERRVERLSRHVEDMGLERSAGEVLGESSRVSVDVAVPWQSLEARIALLEAVAEAVRSGDEPSEATALLGDSEAEREALAAEAVATYRARVLDAEASAPDKLRALGILRHFPPEVGARDSAVVAEVLRLLDSEIDQNLRTDLVRNLKGIQDPDLRLRLEELAVRDPHPAVREEAIESLTPMYRGSPSLWAWLHDVAENDPHASVRRQARDSLEELASQ